MTALPRSNPPAHPSGSTGLAVRVAVGALAIAAIAALAASLIADAPAGAAPAAPAAARPAGAAVATAQPRTSAAEAGQDALTATTEALGRLREERRATASPNGSPDIDALLTRLKDRLARQPEDADGWLMLAHSNASLERHADAAAAYARVAALRPTDAQVRADWADAVAMQQGGTARGEPARLLAEALRLDPRNVKAQVMSGMAALERADPNAARRHFEAASALAEPGSELARAMRARLAALPASGAR